MTAKELVKKLTALDPDTEINFVVVDSQTDKILRKGRYKAAIETSAIFQIFNLPDQGAAG